MPQMDINVCKERAAQFRGDELRRGCSVVRNDRLIPIRPGNNRKPTYGSSEPFAFEKITFAQLKHGLRWRYANWQSEPFQLSRNLRFMSRRSALRCCTTRYLSSDRNDNQLRKAKEETTMRSNSQQSRDSAPKRCAVCGGRFGLVRYYSGRTALCSRRCTDCFKSRRESDRRWLVRWRAP